MLSFSEVQKLNRKGNVIPVFQTLPADMDTPVAAFNKLARNKRDSFLLESIEGGEKLARYSFLGFDPFLIMEGTGSRIKLITGTKKKILEGAPHEFLRELFAFYKPVRVEGLPRFTGGAVGYFAYDTVRWVEKIPDSNPDNVLLPEMRFGLFSRLIVFDHLKQEMLIIANILHDHGQPGLKVKYQKAVEFIGQTANNLAKPARRPVKTVRLRHRIKALCEQKTFHGMVRKAKHYIKEGDIFQVVLSQRWEITSRRPALEVYRRLRRINPSPYMFLLKFGENAVIGSSPEMMVRIEKGMVETRPIAGTRPRGKDILEDDRLSKDLLADKKELAEHTMLVDLGRNDVGRVCEAGSVRVKELMSIEKYSHVIHIVSSVEGKLSRDKEPLDAFFACFPAGTVSGAPKIRAMEIIDELESERRSVYAGAVAYLDFWGNLDSCITIRTVVKRGDKYLVQAGAGIVADSRPEKEYRETIAKAGVLMEAIIGETDK